MSKLFRFSIELGNEPKTEFMILPIAELTGPRVGVLKLSREVLSFMVANFEAGVKGDALPIDYDHQRYRGDAAGWIKGLELREDGLWATNIEWTPKGIESIKNKEYRKMSPDFWMEYVDEMTGTEHGPVLSGLAITNYPALKSLEPIAASEKGARIKNSEYDIVQLTEVKADGEDAMTLKEILKKEANELTAAEKAFLLENAESLSDENKQKFAEVLKASDAAEDQSEDESTEGAEDTDAAKDEAEDESEDSEDEASSTDQVKMSEQEYKTLQMKADAGYQAQVELKKMKLTEEVKTKYLFSQQGGKIAPKAKDTLVELLLSMSDKQRKMFDVVMQAIPEKKMFSEDGHSQDINSDASTMLNKLAEKMATEKNIKFSEALIIISKEKPELYQQYQDSMAGGQ